MLDAHRDAHANSDSNFEEAVARALPGTIARIIPASNAERPTASLIRVPIGWVLQRVTTTLTAQGRLEAAYLFEPLTTPDAAGHVIIGPAFRNAVSSEGGLTTAMRREVADGLIRSLRTGWPPLASRFGTLSAFVSYAIPPPKSPDRDLVPELLLALGCYQVLSNRLADARRTLIDVSAIGDDEAAVFYAHVLLDRLDDPSSARRQVLEWRLQRLSQLTLTDLAASAPVD